MDHWYFDFRFEPLACTDFGRGKYLLVIDGGLSFTDDPTDFCEVQFASMLNCSVSSGFSHAGRNYEHSHWSEELVLVQCNLFSIGD